MLFLRKSDEVAVKVVYVLSINVSDAPWSTERI